jgi:hypothetical protein
MSDSVEFDKIYQEFRGAYVGFLLLISNRIQMVSEFLDLKKATRPNEDIELGVEFQKSKDQQGGPNFDCRYRECTLVETLQRLLLQTGSQVRCYTSF